MHLSLRLAVAISIALTFALGGATADAQTNSFDRNATDSPAAGAAPVYSAPAPRETWLPPLRFEPRGRGNEIPVPFIPGRHRTSAGQRAVRIVSNLVIGTGAGVMGGLTGAAAGFGLGALVSGGNCWSYSACSIGTAIGGTFGVLVAVPWAVISAGYIMDGDGSWGWTLAGSLAGALIGVSIIYGSALTYSATAMAVGGFFGVISPALGAIIAYEATSSGSRRYSPRRRSPVRRIEPAGYQSRWMPFLAPSPSAAGAVFGLAGVF